MGMQSSILQRAGSASDSYWIFGYIGIGIIRSLIGSE